MSADGRGRAGVLCALVAALTLGALGCDTDPPWPQADAAPGDLATAIHVEPDLGAPRDLAATAPGDLATRVARDLATLPPRDLARPALIDLSRAPDAQSPVVPDVVHQIANVDVETLAGSDQPGGMDGSGASAQFDNPVGLALDGDGLMYVTEYDGNRVRSVDASGTVRTITASGGLPQFVCPFAITIASATELVVQTDCDPSGNKGPTSGTLWRIAIATGVHTAQVQGLGRPRGLVAIGNGAVAVSDRTVETLSTLGMSSTSLTLLAGSAGSAAYLDGTGAGARFDSPYGLARRNDGVIFVADQENNRVRAVTSGGAVTTLAGGPEVGCVDGTLAAARFSLPNALAVDSFGDLFVSDGGCHRIRRISHVGVVETVAGDGSAGFRDGDGAQAEFYGQEGIAVTPDGKTLYVADGNLGDGSAFHRLRVITIP